MAHSIRSIALDKLVPHPDNPNRMSQANLNKLIRNIKRSGLYEPLVVRPHPKDHSYFEIINGLHRCKALKELGYEEADCVVWDVDDEQALVLLATLNRLVGSDELGKKLKLLKRLNEKSEAEKLAKLLPQTAKQIERLCNLKIATAPAKASAGPLVSPMVFFVTDHQKQIIEKAMAIAMSCEDRATKAQKNASVLTAIAQNFINNSTTTSGGFK